MSYDQSYAKYIDHTLLKACATKEMIKQFCEEAKAYGFASVCVAPSNVYFTAQMLRGSEVKTCSVAGFPLGNTTTNIKVEECREAIKNGAQEMDMVINIGALKEKNYDYVYQEIRAVVEACHPKALVKVILETSELTDDEKIIGCELAKSAGADFVKTSTGFASGGATVADVALMKAVVGDSCKVKASTGINNREVCDRMIQAGAVRMGTSKGIKIVQGDEDNSSTGY